MALDSYVEDIGVLAAVALVNELTPGQTRGRPMPAPIDTLAAGARALAIDPESAGALTARDAVELSTLAARLRNVFVSLQNADVDKAAALINNLLSMSPANPILAKEGDRWHMHHHPTDVGLAAQWTAICATGLARMLGIGHHDRLGVCEAHGCDRVFADTSKNGSRRFCSTTCQNRIKATAFRRRRAKSSQ